MTFNIELYNTLRVIETTDSVQCVLINMDDETQRFLFLLPPNSISISGGAEYQTKNAMFGSKPYVKYRSSTPTRLTIDNLRLLTPNTTRDLSSIEAMIDSLRYPSGLRAPEEIEDIDETPFFEENPDMQLGYRYNVGGQFPGGRPPQQGNRPPQQGQPPQQGNRPPNQGGQQPPQQGQFPGSGSQIPQLPNQPPTTPQDPNRPPEDPTNPPPDNEEPVDPTDPNSPEIPEEPEVITPIPVIQAVANEPPKLSLVFGERVIQPLRLESYVITEEELNNGLPTNIVVSMTFIGVDNPII